MSKSKKFEAAPPMPEDLISLDELWTEAEIRNSVKELNRKSVRTKPNEGQISVDQISEEMTEALSQIINDIKEEKDSYFFKVDKPSGNSPIRQLWVFRAGDPNPIFYEDDPESIEIFFGWLKS